MCRDGHRGTLRRRVSEGYSSVSTAFISPLWTQMGIAGYRRAAPGLAVCDDQQEMVLTPLAPARLRSLWALGGLAFGAGRGESARVALCCPCGKVMAAGRGRAVVAGPVVCGTSGDFFGFDSNWGFVARPGCGPAGPGSACGWRCPDDLYTYRGVSRARASRPAFGQALSFPTGRRHLADYDSGPAGPVHYQHARAFRRAAGAGQQSRGLSMAASR